MVPCSEIAYRARRKSRALSERSYLFTMSEITRATALRHATTRNCFLDGRAAMNPGWWSQTGSNRRPPACKAGALPTELWPRRRTEDRRRRQIKARSPRLSSVFRRPIMVGLGRFELPTSRLSSARSNQLSYKPGSEDKGRDDRLCRRSPDVCPPKRLVREEREMKTAASRQRTEDGQQTTDRLRLTPSIVFLSRK